MRDKTEGRLKLSIGFQWVFISLLSYLKHIRMELCAKYIQQGERYVQMDAPAMQTTHSSCASFPTDDVRSYHTAIKWQVQKTQEGHYPERRATISWKRYDSE